MDLTIKSGDSQVLTPAQEEFNKRIKALEKARASYDRKRARLDKYLAVCRNELMPWVEARNRQECEMIFLVADAHRSMRLTARRRTALEGLLLCKISDLREDSVGLGEEEMAKLDALCHELDPPDESDGPEPDDEESEARDREEFEKLRAMLEDAARHSGVDLDLSGLNPDMDPEEFEQIVMERMQAAVREADSAAGNAQPGRKTRRKRKPSKAALERERLKQEAEEAKKRDFKSLYKQLAKVLHPDLEADAGLKAQKEAWMKRLTTARNSGDLREMLAIEVEWLGREAGNLTQAADDKLRVYSMVLKEQLAELRQRTRMLPHEPEYMPLRRFITPDDDRLNANIIKPRLFARIDALKEMTDILRAGGAEARKLIHDSADQHARIFGV